MARVNDGGASSPTFGAGFLRSIGNTATAASRSVARQALKKKPTRRSTASAPRRVANHATRNVNRIGRSVARAAQPQRRRTSSQPVRRRSNNQRQQPVVRRQTPARISRPNNGVTRSGVVAPAVPAPVVPKFNQAYLSGDTAYMTQDKAYRKALDDFAARSGASLKDYGTEYNAKLGEMQKAQTQGALDLKDDYASRGLLTSGVYADALNDFNNSYTTQRDELARAKQQYETDLANQKTDFTTEQNLLLQKAKQDALNRYNDRYRA